MTEIRVVPSGKVYRQMFQAQAHLSVTLHERWRKRAAQASSLSEDNPNSSNTGTGSYQHPLWSHTAPEQCSEDTMRNQLFSGTKTLFSIGHDDQEEIRGLPDTIVPAKTGSDIIEQLMEKKQSKHMEAVTELQSELIELSVKYDAILIATGEEFLTKLAVYDKNMEILMQKTENSDDIEGMSYQDLQEIWTSVSHESAMRRNCIQVLDELFAKYETERAALITEVLRKYTMKFEKISYILAGDVHRLIHYEAMMINQALLANRQALAKLHLNLMEKDLEKEFLYHMRWETNLQDWKRIKVDAAVSKFKKLMNLPEIQSSNTVQGTLNSMRTKQKAFVEQRLKILEQVRKMAPPNCSKSSAAEWFSSLSSVNEQIDCLHNDTLTILHEYVENTCKDCSLKVECFKTEISTYRIPSEEIQCIVNSEMLLLISEFQTQAEERLGEMKKAFEALELTTVFLSKSLFKFVSGAANIWEAHSAGLQRKEQQMQDSLDEVRKNYEDRNHKKEAQLDVMMDKLRQESTQEALQDSLEKTINILEEIKEGCVSFYKESIDIVESYPVLVLEEVHAYSMTVSQYFNVTEIYIQDPEELQILYPSLKLGASQISYLKKEQPLANLCPDTFQKITPQAHTDLTPAEESINYISPEDSQNSETFTTITGNTYHCPVIQCADDAAAEQMNVMVEAEEVLYPKKLVVELQRELRQKFFSHLEQRNQEVLNYTVAILEAKKEKLKSELDLRLHLHQPRAKRIELDVYNVRSAELSFHQDRVDRHCKGILQALSDLRADFNNLQNTQCKRNEDFCNKIYCMEDMLYNATKSDTLVKLGASLQTSLTEHIHHLQELQRQFRQIVENRLEGLREASVQLIKHFKLFAEGGTFTPQEIEQYRTHLEKMAKCINTTDEALMLSMEDTESKILKQAKEVISNFDEKLQFHKADLMFLEKIQRVLTNTQVQIKSEVMKSNSQKKMINVLMSEVKDMLDAYTRLDNGVTSADIFGLTSSLIEELRKRNQYLDCYLDPSMTVPLPDMPLQGAFAVAARSRSRKQERVKSPEADTLNQPSCMGAAFMDDKAVGVIRGLLRMSKPKHCAEDNVVLKETNTETVKAPVRLCSPPRSGQKSRKNMTPSGLEFRHKKSADSINSQRRYAKPTRLDQRFQVFGPKPHHQPEMLTFKSAIVNILWEANDRLLQVAEDFYKKKERRLVSRPEYIQESFELCAEDLNKRLLVYQSQTHMYHHGCVKEFSNQLKTIEEIVCEIPKVLLTKLRDQYLEDLSESLTLIHQQFEHTQHNHQKKKREHSRQLRVRLSHPACEGELNRLVKAEDDRQEEERMAIEENRLGLQDCIKKNADAFVTALATLSEKLFLHLDNILTVNEIQCGSIEPKQENITTLIRRAQAGTLQEERTLLDRGSRTWPGIGYIEMNDGSSMNPENRETVSITTAKTTLAQLKILECRDALHQNYGQKIKGEIESVVKFSQKQEAEVFHWQKHWQEQLKTLSTLNSE